MLPTQFWLFGDTCQYKVIVLQAGETPLHIAVRYCHWEVAEELLRFVAQDRSKMDAALLVNAANAVSPEKLSPMKNRHDDVIKWKHFPRYWTSVRGIHRSPVNSPHKGQWRWDLMFSLICARTNGWVNYRYAGDLRRHRAHYDVIVSENRDSAWCQLCHHWWNRRFS